MKQSVTVFLCVYVWFCSAFGEIAPEHQIPEAKVGAPACLSDIVLLVDQSTSITYGSYKNYVIPFLLNITNSFDIAPDRSHISMVRFCNPDETDIVFDFTFPQDVSKINAKIFSSGYATGSTSLVKALNITYDWIYTSEHGARKFASDTTRVAIIITDGVATDAENPDYIPTVDMLIKDKHLNMFAVGVGKMFTLKYLQMLTGNIPDRVFNVDQFDQLKSIVDAVISAAGCSTGRLSK